MFIFFISTFIASPNTNGFHEFKVSQNSPFELNLASNSAIFILNDIPGINTHFTTTDPDGKSTEVQMNTINSAIFSNTNIKVTIEDTSEFSLTYWIIPQDYCRGIAYSLQSDYILTFSFQSKNLKSDFCIFTQTSANYYQTKFKYTMNSNSKINIHDSKMTVVSECGYDGKCDYDASEPYFIRTIGAKNSSFSGTMTYSVTRPDLSNVDCSFSPISHFKDGVIKSTHGFFSVQGTKCYSAAEERLTNVTLISSLVFVAVLILIVLHCSGFMNLKRILHCSDDKGRFNELKENPYANEIEITDKDDIPDEILVEDTDVMLPKNE